MDMNLSESLRQSGIAQVFGPEDVGYDAARAIWNADIDRRPKAIARCAGVADIIDAVEAAARSNLPLSIRGGAHNAAGYALCDDGIVIDLSAMRGIRIDAAGRRATVQTGVVWRDLDRDAQALGLVTPGGMISNTGVAGLTLGGGIGWLMGKFGMVVDNVLGFDVVTADGRYLRADAENEPDLFWALRGGGGNFGVVTAIDYSLHPFGPLVLGGLIAHPIASAEAVLRFYREASADMPDEAELNCGLLTHPEAGPIVALLPCWNGDPDEGMRYFDPVLNFGSPMVCQVAPMPHVAHQSMLDEGTADYGIRRYWKSGFATELSDKLIDTVAEAARGFSSPLSSILFFRFHGAATRPAPDATAYGLRGLKWDFNVMSQWTDPAESARHKDWTRSLWARLEPLTAGMAYLNHLSGEERPEVVRASFGGNYDRLARIKRRYDPENLFRINTNIVPAQ